MIVDYSTPPDVGSRYIDELHFHHSAGSELDTIAQVTAGAMSRGDKHFAGDPYNFHVWRPPDDPEIPLDANKWIVEYGRPAHLKPASIEGRNTHALAVVVHGRWDTQPLPLDAQERLVDVLAWLCRSFDIPVSRVFGHRERDTPGHTVCPGYDPEVIRRALAQRLSSG